MKALNGFLMIQKHMTLRASSAMYVAQFVSW